MTYSLAQAPAGMTINSQGLISWNTTAADVGDQNVIVDVTSGAGLVTQFPFTLDVIPDTVPPTVDVQTSVQKVAIGTSFAVLVEATDPVGVTSMTLSATEVTPSGTTTIQIPLVPGTSSGSASAIVSFPAAGLVTFNASASDAAGNVGTSSANVTVYDPSITEAPVAAITSPTENQDVTAPIPVIGTVSDPENALVSWTLSITPNYTGDLPSADDLAQNETTTVIATGTSPIVNGTLGTLDPTLLQNGNYTLNLTDTNAGGLTSGASVDVTVSGNLKLGALNLSFTDMTIQAAGIPITITRNYSSLDANTQGAFGYGWSLSMSNTKVQVFHQSNELSGFGDYIPFEDGDRVNITLPNGTVDKFTFEAVPGSSLGGAVFYYSPSFVPDAGTQDQLLVENNDNIELQQIGNEWVNIATGDSYNPALEEFGGTYTVQMHNGTQLTIDASTGDLSSITDLNGNSVTITGTGIESSSGPSVQFTYAPNGDISSITSSTGQTVNYGYDNNGNLISFTDADGNTTQFEYLSNPAHYLSAIIGPNGVQMAAAQYDSQGRVSSITNADGDTDNISYNLSAQSETTFDALDNPTTTYYDDNGNPIEVVNALGGVTLNTYDSNNDELSTTEVTPDGNVTTTYTYDQYGDRTSETDPDGTSTQMTYNDFGQPLTHTDSLGNVTTYTYDQNGNLLSASTPGQGTVSYGYDSEGNPVGITDQLGTTMPEAYDANGNLLSSTDPFGVSTSYAYDSNGNQTSSTFEWVNPNNPSDVVPVTTSTTYDANGNVLSQTDAEGNTTSTTYTPAGKVATTTASNGDVTQNVYDAAGNLIETREQSEDSSGNTEWIDTLNVYDADGNVVAQTNPFAEGSTAPITGTLTTYDALGDAIETQRVTGIEITITGSGANVESVLTSPGTVMTASTAQYDDQGDEVSTVNQNGLASLSIYDGDGRTVDASSSPSTGTEMSSGWQPRQSTMRRGSWSLPRINTR